MSETITIIVALVGVFSMFGKSLDRYNISPPMVFISIGILTGSFLRQVPATDNSTNMEIVLLVAELTLIVVLFHDASTVQIRDLYVSFPTRMLAIGLPMTLILLYYTTAALMPFLGLHGALLIAAALTPTDAGLGAPTILNPAVPSRVRQALNVESGINDGLITPIVLIAIEGLARSAGNSGTPDIPSVALVPISIAIGLAAGIAPVYAMVLDHSAEQKWSTFSGRSIAIVMLPLLMWGLSIATGANSFIAAFLAGGFFGYFSKSLHSDHALPELLEAVADFLSYCAWFFAGELLLDAMLAGFQWEWLGIALLALIPFRMIPVYISLLGTGMDFNTMSFLGWFGPRGLATVIFALLTVEELEKTAHDDHHEGEKEERILNNITGTLLLTVLISVFAHGYSAAPLARIYSEYMADKAKALEARGHKADSSLDLNPRIIMRSRGKGHVLSKQLRASPSMNFGRFLDAQDSGARHTSLPRKQSASVSLSHLADLPMMQDGSSSKSQEEEEILISLPYTKTSNLTVLRKSSMRFHLPGESLAEIPEEEEETELDWEHGDELLDYSDPLFLSTKNPAKESKNVMRDHSLPYKA
mmetsp:Transcript_35215/g.77589  ORF Transcript_35215/g.77589 Transcript_35215/m.77589 type:complete len:588 (+) Transcript_35215:371-2134(+)